MSFPREFSLVALGVSHCLDFTFLNVRIKKEGKKHMNMLWKLHDSKKGTITTIKLLNTSIFIIS